MELTERQEVVLRFLVTKAEPVKPIQLVFPNHPTERSPLPKTELAAYKTFMELTSMGLVKKVGRTEIHYESTPEAAELV